MALLSDIRTRYNRFSRAQKDIADFILKDPEKVTLLSITELAKNCDTSETTVMRLLKKLDLDSYQVFRILLAKEITESPKEMINDDFQEEDTISIIKEKVIKHTLTSMQDLSESLEEETLDKAVEMISNAHRIYTFGVGASQAIATDAFHKLIHIGFDCFTYPDAHLMNTLLAHADENDLFIAVSHTGESNEVLKAAEIAKLNGVKVLALVSYDNSTLAKIADLRLLSSTNSKKYHSEAMASRILQLAIIDILYVALFMQDEELRFNKLNDSRFAISRNKT